MIRRIGSLLSGVSLGVALLSTAGDAAAIPRGEVMARAKSFAFHPWTCGVQNLTASCAPSYQSVHVPGDYVGLPYDWGGYMTLFQFDQAIAAGSGAGSYPEDGVLSCTSGLDCSGFVSKAWDTGHHTTASLPQIAAAINVGQLLAGDVFNISGYHVALFSHLLGNGEPVLYEALGYNVHLNTTGGWNHVDGYTPRRFSSIEGNSAVEPVGTPVAPIVIGSFPYTDSRDTSQSGSDLLDGCGAAPSKAETGPEYVYKAVFTKPGTLMASIVDDVNSDIDIHLYTSMNTSDCIARHDTTITVNVDCGTYYLVADTFKGASEKPGPYTLTATFTASAAPCGNGPPVYAPSGGPGEACGYPGDPDLPFCNPNLGADTCLYTDQDSFCSMPCADDSDCAGLAGGCCGDLGGGDFYCFNAALCGNPTNPPDQNGQPDAGGDPPLDGGAAVGSGGGATVGVGGSGGAGAEGNAGAANEGGGSGKDPTDKGGCSAGGSSPRSPGGLSLAAVALALVIARRRRALPRN